MGIEKIVVLGTGGTIAGTAANASDNIGYTAGQVGVRNLIEAIPSLRQLEPRMIFEQVAQLDSKDMSFAVWSALLRRLAYFLEQHDVSAVVITHGTDTIEETAFLLQAALAPEKPVVLTCSMRPSSSMSPDGPQNLTDALGVATSPGARGVVVVCAGVIHSAIDIQKVHPYRLDPFSSGEAGPVGVIEEGRCRLYKPWPAENSGFELKSATESIAASAYTVWPRVEIVLNYAGVDGRIVDTLQEQGVQGIVVAATGNGTVHAELQAALVRARNAGTRVVRASRCVNGRILSSADSLFPDSRGLSPVKARIQLMLELMAEAAP